MANMNHDDRDYSQQERDNHSNQMNDNNDAYWSSRGEDGRPDDWQDRVAGPQES